MILNGIDKMIKDPLLDKETRHREAIICTNCSIIERKASMFFSGQLEGDEKKRLLSEIITLAQEAQDLLEKS